MTEKRGMKIVLLNGKSFESDDWILTRTTGRVNLNGGMVFYFSERLNIVIPVSAIAYIINPKGNKNNPFDGD